MSSGTASYLEKHQVKQNKTDKSLRRSSFGLSKEELSRYVKEQHEFLDLLPSFSEAEIEIIRRQVTYSAIRLGAYHRLVRNTAKIIEPIGIGLTGIAMMALLTLTPLGLGPEFWQPGLSMLATAMSILIGVSLFSVIHYGMSESMPYQLTRAILVTNFGDLGQRPAPRKHRKGRNLSVKMMRRRLADMVVLVVCLTGNGLLSLYRWWPWYTVLTLAVMMPLALLQVYVLPERITRFLPRAKKIGLMPTDVLLIEMIELALRYRALYLMPKRYWFRYVIGLTETAARHAEQALIFNQRVPVFNSDVRHLLKEDARKFAEIIRSHKIAAARVGTWEQGVQVSESMCSGIYALMINDWATLAPTSHSSRTRVNRFKRALPRLISASVLVAASFLLPLLPQLHEEKAQSASLRIALLAAAILALVSTSQYATERVTDVLGRSLRWPSAG
jgi:hypothetical protein